jgi:sortase A
MGISCPIGLDERDTGLTRERDRPADTGELGAPDAALTRSLYVATPHGAARRSRADTALRVLQALLLFTGGLLLVVYAAAQVDAGRGSEQALEAFAAARNARADSESLQPAAEPALAPLEYPNDPDQSLWGKARIAAYRNSLSVHDGAPLGVLTIPSIRLEAPIFDGTSEITLNRGIGRIEGTASLGAAGNLGLAGHRDGFFRPLKDVHVGDAISLESLAGVTRYRITELLIVEPTDVHVLAPTDTATLTLVTCYPFYFIGEAPQRYIVKAVAESSTASVVP